MSAADVSGISGVKGTATHPGSPSDIGGEIWDAGSAAHSPRERRLRDALKEIEGVFKEEKTLFAQLRPRLEELQRALTNEQLNAKRLKNELAQREEERKANADQELKSRAAAAELEANLRQEREARQRAETKERETELLLQNERSQGANLAALLAQREQELARERAKVSGLISFQEKSCFGGEIRPLPAVTAGSAPSSAPSEDASLAEQLFLERNALVRSEGELKAALAKVRREADESRGLLEQCRTQLGELQREKDRLLVRLATVEAELLRSTQTEGDLRGEAVALRERAHKLDAELQQTKGLLIDAEAMKAALWQELNEAQTAAREQRQELVRLSAIINGGVNGGVTVTVTDTDSGESRCATEPKPLVSEAASAAAQVLSEARDELQSVERESASLRARLAAGPFSFLVSGQDRAPDGDGPELKASPESPPR